MTYSRACELLGLTTPKTLKENSELAKSKLSTMTTKTPLKYKVAVKIIVEASL